ncbi:hypothetical protein QJQ45_027463 [Haematococcus lacustris]|nr:hypothetical protein QJQ45_027463 [Haematococcus lacustris]
MQGQGLGRRTSPAPQVKAPRLHCHHRRRTIMQATPAPKTGHHIVESALREEALSKFFPENLNLTCSPTSGGVNNVCQYVDTSDGHRYLLRIYNNGGRSDKVEYEHRVLQELQKHQSKLSFCVPKALPSKANKPHELLSNGAECCVFEIIPGTLAKTTSPQEVGRATGQLSAAMSLVHVDMVAPTARYTDVFLAHHAMNRDLFYSEVANNPAFNVCREAIDYLTDEIRAIEKKLERFNAMDLPMSMIHGDLHYDNVMVVGDQQHKPEEQQHGSSSTAAARQQQHGSSSIAAAARQQHKPEEEFLPGPARVRVCMAAQVSGLLDFEFCLYDWRAMELAVALSKYVGEDQPLPLCEEFITGFVEHGELTDAEIDIIPDLINLRIFSNVVYFIGRAVSKEDSIDSLTSRAGTYAKRVRWVNANAAALSAQIRNKMAALKQQPQTVLA